MKFIIVQEICHIHEDRLVILKREEDYFKRGRDFTEVKYLCNAVILVTKDWNLFDDISIVDDTASIQYRPKGIFRNKKGFYYKHNGTVYLNTEEVDEMFTFMGKALNFLNPTENK